MIIVPKLDRDPSAVDALLERTADDIRDDATAVADAMSPAPYVVSIFTPVGEVVQTMADHRYGSAVIVDGGQRVRGIFTTIDALALLATLVHPRRSARPTRTRPTRRPG